MRMVATQSPATQGLIAASNGGGWSRRALMAGVLASSAGLAGCFSDTSLNYRLTLNLLVDGRPVSGSSVRRLTWHEGGGIMGWMNASRHFTTGDAAVVELGERGLLFATLAYKQFDQVLQAWFVQGAKWMPLAAFQRALGGDLMSWRGQQGVEVALLATELPLLVTFRDVRDPRSVVEVDPENLDAVFGPNVTFTSGSVEVVREPVTRGEIRRVLPWLGGTKNATLNGRDHGASPALYDNLYTEHFSVRNG